MGDLGLIAGLGRFPREGKGYPLKYSGLENSMDCIVRGVSKSGTLLNDFHFYFQSLLKHTYTFRGRANCFWEVKPALPYRFRGVYKELL